jgi:hypothetical protein
MKLVSYVRILIWVWRCGRLEEFFSKMEEPGNLFTNSRLSHLRILLLITLELWVHMCVATFNSNIYFDINV